jgi:acylphosphatase
MRQRVHVYYEGMVQGVGFRYTAEYIAGTLDVTGWVRNVSDGRVELVAEGNEDSLKELLGTIKEKMSPYIYNESIEWEPYTGEFQSFDIRFY